MVDLKKRLLSRREVVLIYTAVLLPVQFWMLYNLLMAFPAYLPRLSMWDLLGLSAYTLAFALVESLLLFAGLAFLVFLAPHSLRGEKLTVCISMLVLILSLWSILFHIYYECVIAWDSLELGLWLVIVLGSLALFIGLTLRNHRLRLWMIAFLDRASVLTALFLIVNLFSVLIIAWRNIAAMADL